MKPGMKHGKAMDKAMKGPPAQPQKANKGGKRAKAIEDKYGGLPIR